MNLCFQTSRFPVSLIGVLNRGNSPQIAALVAREGDVPSLASHGCPNWSLKNGRVQRLLRISTLPPVSSLPSTMTSRDLRT